MTIFFVDLTTTAINFDMIKTSIEMSKNLSERKYLRCDLLK